jgi:type 2 lantibiotic biosynthesis protein LanM
VNGNTGIGERLARVVSRARPLSQRIRRHHGQSATVEHAVESQDVLAEWKAVYASCPSLFQNRLRLDGLTEDSLWSVSSDRMDLTTEEQSMVRWLAMAIEVPEQWQFQGEFRHIPFSDALTAFATLALDDLRSSTVWSSNARYDITEALVQKLSELCFPTLLQEFSKYRGCPNPQSTIRYQEFIDGLWNGGWLALFDKYPVLARLIAAESLKWQRFFAETESRLKDDEATLRKEFCIPAHQSFPIASVQIAGDMHDGRSVLCLTAAGSQRFVYKPRSIAVDICLNDMLETLNSDWSGGVVRFGVTQFISREQYGYQSFVPHCECTNEQQTRQAFRNYGALLGVLHILGATDAHYENLIVSGVLPHFIDAETLLQSDSAPFSFDSPNAALPSTFAGEYWLPSVARVGLLPAVSLTADPTADTGASDYSALGYIHPGHEFTARCVNVNTDGMFLEEQLQPKPQGLNVVRAAGRVIEPRRYVTEIENGYSWAVRCTVATVSQHGLRCNSHERTRTIFRSTRVYSGALWRSVQPERLTSGVTHSLTFEPLAFAFCLNSGNKDRWPIFLEEQQQLEQMDVPRFERTIGSRSLFCPRQRSEIYNFFVETSLVAMSLRCRSVERNLIRDCKIIRGSLAIAEEHKNVDQRPVGEIREDSANYEQLKSHCCDINRHLLDRAVFTRGGNANWICGQRVPRSERMAYRPLGDSLYNGRLGVALFVAAMDRLIPSARAKEVIEGATRELTTIAGSSSLLSVFVQTLEGGLSGAGGILYSLLGISILSGQQGPLETACRVAAAILESGVDRRWGIDLFSGLAGFVFGLARLNALACDANLQRGLIDCAMRLRAMISRQEMAVDGTRSVGCPPGLAHGRLGAGLGLLEASRGGHSQELLDFGAAVVSEEIAAHFRNPDETVMRRSLCRGEAGVLIAHRLSANLVDLPPKLEFRRDQLSPTAEMTVCCGRAGQWIAANTLTNTELRENLKDWRPPLILLSDDEGRADLSLFRGLSGLGWAVMEQAFCTEKIRLFEFGLG